MSEVFDKLAAASRNWAGDAPTGAMLVATRAFQSAASADESVLREAAAALGSLEPGAVAWSAVTFGTLVERGAAAEITGPAVLEQLRAWLPRLPAHGTDASLALFRYLGQAAVAHLARLPAQRLALGRDAALIERLDALRVRTPGAWWVYEALLKSSGTLVLLHPPGGTGLRLSYANVSHGFHLFSLLQTAVGTSLPGGREPDDAVARVARGQSSDTITDEAWWHYGTPLSPKPDAAATIRGEDLAREIPRVDGEQVVLLWPPILRSRTWDSGLYGPHLEAMPADATVERMLTADECRAWLATLGVERRRKSWWPFRVAK
jgi:hypothetical protein